MDTPVERKPGINRKHLYTIGGVALGIAVILYFIFIDTASSMTVEKDRLTIATALYNKVFTPQIIAGNWKTASRTSNAVILHPPVL